MRNQTSRKSVLSILNSTTAKCLATAAAVLAVVMSTNSATAATVTIDFDEFNTGQNIPGDTFTDLGVVFDNSFLAVSAALGADPQSPPNSAFGVAMPGATNNSTSGSFTQAVDFISVFAQENSSGSAITLNGFDSLNNLVASNTVTNNLDLSQKLSIFGSGIRRFEIGSVTDAGVAIDDFTFNTAEPVPEPLTILGTLTAAGIGVVMKRKTRLKAN